MDLPAGFRVKLAKHPHDVSESDIATLSNYGGELFGQQFCRAFDAGKICVLLHSNDGRLAAVCWAEKALAFPPCTPNPCMILSRCFTLPQFRGRGLYPAAITALDHLLPEEMRDITELGIECSMFNHSSHRGIEKAGFRIGGTAIEFGRRRLTWKKR